MIHAPTWFTRALPKMKVEGELWAGRGNFHVVQQTVLDRKPIDAAWREIKFMLFDLPETAGDFRQRYSVLIDWVNHVSEPHIGYIKHVATTSQIQLFSDLDEVHQNGGEGLMLRKFDSEYTAGRSHDLLKLKHHQDDEAVVIGYKTGNGKYAGMLGSLLVQWRDGKQFYLGSGLSDSQRIQPPPIGSVVTFRYNGLTSSGLPRFARFERLRVD
ncbi:DNA ligase [Vibrio ponticus]|nr:DNA ligase [Vibrio ponticus]